MLKTTIVIMGIVLVTLLTFACSGNSAQNAKPIRATWVTARMDGDTVRIPADYVKSSKIIHFRVNSVSGTMAFMAYELEGETYVRANICPPCRSVGFSLRGDTLVCDTCATLFNARTGAGISGACVDYPKAAAPFTTIDGNLTMSADDLTTASQQTLVPGP